MSWKCPIRKLNFTKPAHVGNSPGYHFGDIRGYTFARAKNERQMRTPKKMRGKMVERTKAQTDKQTNHFERNKGTTNVVTSSLYLVCIHPSFSKNLLFPTKTTSLPETSIFTSRSLHPDTRDPSFEITHPYVDLKCQRHSWEPPEISMSTSHC